MFVTVAGAQSPQTPPASFAFEVASIKPAPPLDPIKMAQQMQQGIAPHIGMKVDSARVDIGYFSFTDLIGAAYKVKKYQISGPDWLATQRFDILAKIPEGVSKDQVPEMLKTLLAERFKLAIHHESKEQSVYELGIGKNGLKLKESVPDPEPAANAGPGGDGAPKPVTAIKNDGNGNVTVTGGQAGTTRMQMMPNGQMHIEAAKMTMTQLTDTLTNLLGRPVVDKTGLTGTYQVALDVSIEDLRNAAASAGVVVPRMPATGSGDAGTAAADPGGSSIFAAVQDLGLKLEAKKDPMDTIVVDHLEELPIDN